MSCRAAHVLGLLSFSSDLIHNDVSMTLAGLVEPVICSDGSVVMAATSIDGGEPPRSGVIDLISTCMVAGSSIGRLSGESTFF